MSSSLGTASSGDQIRRTSTSRAARTASRSTPSPGQVRKIRSSTTSGSCSPHPATWIAGRSTWPAAARPSPLPRAPIETDAARATRRIRKGTRYSSCTTQGYRSWLARSLASGGMDFESPPHEVASPLGVMPPPFELTNPALGRSEGLAPLLLLGPLALLLGPLALLLGPLALLARLPAGETFLVVCDVEQVPIGMQPGAELHRVGWRAAEVHSLERTGGVAAPHLQRDRSPESSRTHAQPVEDYELARSHRSVSILNAGVVLVGMILTDDLEAKPWSDVAGLPSPEAPQMRLLRTWLDDGDVRIYADGGRR